MVAEINWEESAGESPVSSSFIMNLFKPVLLRVADSSGEMVSTDTFSHRSRSSCVILSIPSRWGIFSFLLLHNSCPWILKLDMKYALSSLGNLKFKCR